MRRELFWMEKPGSKNSLRAVMSRTWPALPYLGLGLWLAWSTLAFSGGVWLSDIETSGFAVARLNMYSSMSFGVFCILAAFANRFFERLLNSQAIMFFAGALGALGSALIIICGPFYLMPVIGKSNADILFYLGAFLAGVASTFMILKSGQLYSSLSPRRVLINVALSYILLACIFFVVTSAPQWSPVLGGPSLGGVIAFIFVFPVAAFVLMFDTVSTHLGVSPEETTKDKDVEILPRSNGNKSGERQTVPIPYGHKERFVFGGLPTAFWKLLVMLLLISAVVSTMRAFSIFAYPPESTLENSALVMYFMLFFAAFIVTAALSQSLNRINFGKIYSFSALVIGIVIALLPLLGVLDSSLSLIISMTMTVFRFVVFCLLIFICHKKRFLTTAIMGLGYGALMLGDAFGMFIGESGMLELIDEQLQPIIYILIAGFVLVLTFILFSERDFDRLFSSSLSGTTLQSIMEEADMENHVDTINSKRLQGRFFSALESLALEKNLSRREADVFKYLAMGRGTEYIAENLSISSNTVRTHTQNIFVKLDVHSRNELMDLVDQLRK